MGLLRYFLLLLSASVLLLSSVLHAEDIDLYVDNSAASGDLPNVLFVIDTGANFSSNAAVPCTAYSDGTGQAPSLGGTAGGIEQCALVNAIHALPVDRVRIGILVNNNNNFGTSSPGVDKPAWHNLCQGTYGGCVLRDLTVMNATNKASLINFIKSWKTSGLDSNTESNVKSGGARTANMMQEAWAYYRGKIGMSGKSYSPSIVASGCQKNYVLFIGNSFNVSGTPADSGVQSPYDGLNALTSAQVAATTAQREKITQTAKFTAATCGVMELASGSNANNWSSNWADEWSRLMYEQDGGASDAEGRQSITTYSIGLVDNTHCKPDYPALLQSMASYGGGKYYQAATVDELTKSIGDVLNEVQAVNSVFSSASLPVSVNAEGTYENQIYLGMFRPDRSAAPRWVGNLKQYQLIYQGGALVMGDASSTPQAAISASGTGFISPNVKSFLM